eukprot:scaffold25136_cov41-Prasinocladus_malaysianus.AAC.1
MARSDRAGWSVLACFAAVSFFKLLALLSEAGCFGVASFAGLWVVSVSDIRRPLTAANAAATAAQGFAWALTSSTSLSMNFSSSALACIEMLRQAP